VSAYTDMVSVAEELTDGRFHSEKVGQPPRLHRVRIPGLLEQLYVAAVDPSMAAEEGGTRMKPRSRPPLALEALSRYQDISAAVTRWCRSLRLEVYADPARNVRAIVTSAAGKRGQETCWDLDTLEALLAEMRSWRRWAAVLTGWESRPWQPRIMCPVCEGRSTIWVNDVLRTAYCSACLFTWDDAVELAEKVRAA
jgi:hypothetical protein